MILPFGDHPYRDSKELSAAQRERLAARLRGEALGWAVAHASAREIDELGIMAATHLAVARALDSLCAALPPAGLVTDYLRVPWPGAVLAVPRADQRSVQAAAASVLAKAARDEIMRQLDRDHPGYGLAANKGYGARAHLEALRRRGPCPQHRKSFRPLSRAAL